MIVRRSLFVAALSLATAAPVHAEFYGLLNGRLVGRDSLPDRSFEAGAQFGEYDDTDTQYFGARFNYRASPDLMIYGDIGQTEVELNVDIDGIGFGIGGYYIVDGVFSGSDFAVKASYHTVSLEGDNTREFDFTALVVEAVLSGREGLGASGDIGWYANVGMHRLDFDDIGDDETEIGFGGGIVLPRQTGEFYLGIDMIDDLNFGGGYRHFLD